MDYLMEEFQISEEELEGVNIIFENWGGDGSWEGWVFILFERNGVLYEVNGSHCSCYGFEGQWAPEETSWVDLRYRLEKGTIFYTYGCEDELKALIEANIPKWE